MHFNLDVQCKIWANSQNSLIDFESDKATSLSASITTSGYLHLSDSSLRLLPQDESAAGTIVISQVKHGKDIYELELSPPLLPINEPDDTTWTLLHYSQQNPNQDYGYKIREGDLLKFGKFLLKIRQLFIKKDSLIKTMIENKNKTLKEEDDDISRNFIFPKVVASEMLNHNNSCTESNILPMKRNSFLLLNKVKEKTDTKNNEPLPTCRICLSDEHDLENPMINPCKCSGTVKYIHLSCLQRLIQSRMTVKIGENVTMFTFKTLECELCQTNFPEKIKVHKKTYTIIELLRPNNNYMLVEGIMKETPEHKTIYVVAFKEGQPVKIGRASDSSFRLGDISVSRAHAKIVLLNGSFYLYDTNSKFGSMIKAPRNMVVLPQRVLMIIKGKICFMFKMKKLFCAMISCYKPKLKYKNENEYYDEQNDKNNDNTNHNNNNNNTNNNNLDTSMPDYLWIETRTVSIFESVEDRNNNTFQEMKKES